MNKSLVVFTILFLICLTFLRGHEGHHKIKNNNIIQESIHPTTSEQSNIKVFGERPKSWLQWFGGWHFIFLHFPIALIAMTAVSEILFILYLKPIYNYASRFMLASAAILTIPTVIFGLIYSYTGTYSGLLADFLWWHMWLGLLTAIIAILATWIREHHGLNKFYYLSLIFLFVLMNITGALGGGMTFGPYQLLPPPF